MNKDKKQRLTRIMMRGLYATTLASVTFAFSIGFLLYFIPGYSTMSMHKEAGCEGIDKFFTNSSFWTDVSKIQERGHKLNNGTWVDIKSPIALWNNETSDCKTISSAVKCLASLYNKTCEFYISGEIHVRNNEFERAHMGIECERGDGWYTVY